MTNLITANLPTTRSSNSTHFSSRPPLTRFPLDKEKARRRLHEFAIQAWPILEPQTAFVHGMHVLAVCDHLHAAPEGKILNVIGSIPPGQAKPSLSAVFCPVWVRP